jgi:hypothetical protein
MGLALVIIILIILFLIYRYWVSTSEGFDCGCPQKPLTSEQTVILNPYSWPYSATECVDGFYMDAIKNSTMYPSSSCPLDNRNVPDHVVKT